MSKQFKDICVFCDFDGTITFKDLGDELFLKFGSFEPHHSRLISGELRISDYWKILCDSLGAGFDGSIVKNFALSFEIDPYFVRFAELCRSENIPLAVISDGFDSYINPILEREGIDRLRVFSNQMIFRTGMPPYPVFPGASESCGCLCASCKRNIMLSFAPPETIITFIGDGYSDFCAAEHSDIIFAKKSLAANCNKNKLPHYPYSNFFDVSRIFRDIIPKGKIKARNQARQLRNRAFLNE